MEPIDDYIGQPWQEGASRVTVRTKREKRRTLVIVVGIALLLTLPVVSLVAYDRMTSIECTLSVSLTVSETFSRLNSYEEMVIFVDYGGFLGGRVGSQNRSGSSGTFIATFQLNRTGPYEVNGGVQGRTHGAYTDEIVQITRDDDGTTVQVVLRLGT